MKPHVIRQCCPAVLAACMYLIRERVGVCAGAARTLRLLHLCLHLHQRFRLRFMPPRRRPQSTMTARWSLGAPGCQVEATCRPYHSMRRSHLDAPAPTPAAPWCSDGLQRPAQQQVLSGGGAGAP